jgi:hypothetical protein
MWAGLQAVSPCQVIVSNTSRRAALAQQWDLDEDEPAGIYNDICQREGYIYAYCISWREGV